MTRVLLGGCGVAVAAYGGWLLWQRPDDQLVGAGTWLVGGVILHDGVLAPIVLLLGLLAARTLPAGWRGAAAGGLVVLGSVTLVAVPVLGRFGARPDNPTLLDRNYAAGWVVIAAGTAAGVVLAAYLGRRRERRHRGPGAGG
jgi:hypothetical protein